MLSTISWPQYFAAIAVTGTCYYSYIFLRYYQREISGLLTRKTAGSANQEHSARLPLSVIGLIRENPHVSYLDEREVQFAGDDQANIAEFDAEDQVTAKTGPESLQQQLVKETDQLMEAFAAENNKSEFLSLLSILIGAYRQQASNLDLARLATYMQQAAPAKLPFPLFADDLTEILN